MSTFIKFLKRRRIVVLSAGTLAILLTVFLFGSSPSGWIYDIQGSHPNAANMGVAPSPTQSFSPSDCAQASTPRNFCVPIVNQWPDNADWQEPRSSPFDKIYYPANNEWGQIYYPPSDLVVNGQYYYGYNAESDVNDWNNSACSAAALTEDLLALGKQTHLGKTLQQMLDLKGRPDVNPEHGAIAIQGGLWWYHDQPSGLLIVPRDDYGLQADYRSGLTFKQFTRIIRNGFPILVGLTDRGDPTMPSWLGGISHWIVLWNVSSDGRTFYFRDSSRYYITSLSFSDFDSVYDAHAVVISPPGTDPFAGV